MAFLTDVEHPLDAGDEFAHADVAALLTEVVREAPTPFTVGVFGAWGSGKSSILKAMGREVANESVAYVHIDIWRYEDDSLRRQFIRELGGQLQAAHATKRGFDLDRHTERFDTAVMTTRARWQFDPRQILKAMFNALVAGAALLGFLYVLRSLDVHGDSSLPPKVAVGGAALAFVYQALASVLVVSRDQLSRRQIEDADGFSQSYVELLGKFVRPRLVVGIDNLDRCAPERVLEALATIKTFLEPQAGNTELVFVIAADDDALRRHLVAQEIGMTADERGAGSALPSVAQDAADAVDEHLRKFFNVVLRLPTHHTHDIDAFVGTQLAGLAHARKVDEADAMQIRNLLTTFLGGNPRRIKQFMNTLELRARLLERRVDRGWLNLDCDVLALAELLVLAERWPDRLKKLWEEPQAFRDWHREERGRPPQPTHARADLEWSAFLRTVRRLPDLDVRPYLALAEPTRGLIDHREFVRALELGDQKGAGTLLAAAGPDAERYAELVLPLLRDRLRSRYWGDARGIVTATLAIDDLSGPDDARWVEVLRTAYPWGFLWEQLADTAPPAAVLRAAGRVPDDERERFVGLVIDGLGGSGQEGSHARAERAELLKEHPAWLTRQLEWIKTVLCSPHVADDPASWCVLAEECPAVVSDELARLLIERMESREGLPGEDDPGLRALRAARAYREPAWAPRLDRLFEERTGDADVDGAVDDRQQS